MYNRRFFKSQLGKAAFVSIAAMVMLNAASVVVGGQPLLGDSGGFDLAVPSMIVTLA
ncbi:hypothetical protein [Altererythrobacter aquiaggeris]|uniref:hypothetical protein n=1 Tax=Aestuarierythrobacter aquiaggeris TaxID=1898396 RepID=UPI003019313C